MSLSKYLLTQCSISKKLLFIFWWNVDIFCSRPSIAVGTEMSCDFIWCGRKDHDKEVPREYLNLAQVWCYFREDKPAFDKYTNKLWTIVTVLRSKSWGVRCGCGEPWSFLWRKWTFLKNNVSCFSLLVLLFPWKNISCSITRENEISQG